MKSNLDIAFVTDEVSRNLEEALEICLGWGIKLFELREGSEKRTPYLTKVELAAIEEALSTGAKITALSPGVFKQPVENKEVIKDDLERKLPDTLELANRLSCDTVIIFGFEKAGDDASSRLSAQKVFEQAAEAAAREGITVAVENEPAFWVDKPADAVALVKEIGHPNLKMNWDPANLHWGGTEPRAEHLDTIAPYLHNLHIKDFTPDDPQAPWRPIGDGITPWKTLLERFVSLRNDGDVNLNHVTVETHCVPLYESSERSLAHLRELLDEIE